MLLLTLLGLAGAEAPAQAQNEQFIPALVYRTGPYAPNGIPFANGYSDYLAMVNERDGGINGVKIFHPGMRDRLCHRPRRRMLRASEEQRPDRPPRVQPAFHRHHLRADRTRTDRPDPDRLDGYGRANSADGRVFPWVFPILGTYWTQADTLVHYVAMQEGGYDKLKGKKIAFIYHDSPYGKEPIPVFQELAKRHGFQLEMYPVAAPGLEQKSTWLQLARQFKPDWTFIWGWGVMNSTAIKEAAAIGYPRDHFIGVWWSGAEPDVTPAGDGAIGYKSGAMHASGPVAGCTRTSSNTCTTRAKARPNAKRSGRCFTIAA